MMCDKVAKAIPWRKDTFPKIVALANIIHMQRTYLRLYAKNNLLQIDHGPKCKTQTC